MSHADQPTDVHLVNADQCVALAVNGLQHVLVPVPGVLSCSYVRKSYQPEAVQELFLLHG